MSATTAPAPGPITASTAAPRRPAATPAEQPGSFADVLEAAVPRASAPDRPSRAPERSDDGATDVEAVALADAPAPALVPEPSPVAPAVPVPQPLVPAPESQGADEIQAEPDGAVSTAEAGGAIPVTGTVTPPPAQASPAASAAPVAPPLPAKTSAERALDGSAEASLPASPPSAQAATEGTRAVIAPAAGNAAVLSGATAASPASDAAPAAAAASPATADGDAARATAGKPTTEVPPPVPTLSDPAAETSAPVQTAATTATLPGELAASPATGLSTVSQTALNATAQIAAQIIRKLEGQSTRFEMALTPDDLGRVDVSLDIDADGQLSARLAFDNPLAAADLKGRVDELRRQLTDAGFTVADDAFSFDQRQPSAGSGNGFDRGSDRHPARAFGAASRLSIDADLGLNPPRWMSLTLTPERVDMKV